MESVSWIAYHKIQTWNIIKMGTVLQLTNISNLIFRNLLRYIIQLFNFQTFARMQNNTFNLIFSSSKSITLQIIRMRSKFGNGVQIIELMEGKLSIPTDYSCIKINSIMLSKALTSEQLNTQNFQCSEVCNYLKSRYHTCHAFLQKTIFLSNAKF